MTPDSETYLSTSCLSLDTVQPCVYLSFEKEKEKKNQPNKENMALALGTYEVMEIEKTITPLAYGNHKDLGFVYI